MAQESITRLIEAMKSNQTLLSQMKAAKSPADKAAVASNNGFNVTAEEFEALHDLEGKGESELSDADLELVAGGGIKQIIRKAKRVVKEIEKTASDVYNALVG